MEQDTMSRLQRLFTEHPELTQRLQPATSVVEAAERLSAVAAEHGIAIDALTLVSDMEQAQDGGGLSDDQLEGVVGGVITWGTLASFFVREVTRIIPPAVRGALPLIC